MPSNQLLQAMAQLQGQHNIGSDIASMCMARAAAIQQLTYEELHGPNLPDQLRYQRGARWQLATPNAWKRRFDRKSRVSQAYMTACAGVPSIDELDAKITQANCAKWSKPHGPEYGRCVGIGFFSGTFVHNWRVLWWSLPKSTRREHILKLYSESFAGHREQGHDPNSWRMRTTFLGYPVCREAFLVLTGLSNTGGQGFTITIQRAWRRHVHHKQSQGSYISAGQAVVGVVCSLTCGVEPKGACCIFAIRQESELLPPVCA